MTGNEIREAYLKYFQEKGHLRMPSSSLIPAADPTLLLTNAGMVQFKPYFTGEMDPPNRRLTSAQKCFRTTDIDSVGDSTHLTFFEMMVNFSIGDYFKEDAIKFAWEFVTDILGLPKESLWASVFVDDDEAHSYWVSTGVPAERIRRFGEGDNFWGPAGDEGPCGPCSEIHYDFGFDLGCGQSDCGPNCDYIVPGTNQQCNRFIELWNLVFMQFYQAPDGSRVPLPSPNIDTGMGLERAAAILQGKSNVYDTDIFTPLIRKVSEVCGRDYGLDDEIDYGIRVVAEHARSATFLISDGVVPSNDGRGYVLRRLLRRAIRYGRKLGLESQFLSRIADTVVDVMGGQYSDLKERQPFILRVISLEEDRFSEAFARGNLILKGMLDYRARHGSYVLDICSEKKNDLAIEGLFNEVIEVFEQGVTAYEQEGQALASKILLGFTTGIVGGRESGDENAEQEALDNILAWPTLLTGGEEFYLYDTYGFPPELTAEIAKEHGFKVDVDGFEREMEIQRLRARTASARFGGDFDAINTYHGLGLESTLFSGYETLNVSTVVVGLLVNGEQVGSVNVGSEVEVLLKETPFYAEMGGQVGDTGQIMSRNDSASDGISSTVIVRDTYSPIAGLIVHSSVVENGSISLGDLVEANVDLRRRQDTTRNHTATHILHAVLRNVLGGHVRQHGSLVTPDRLRFDFSHIAPLSPEELKKIEQTANEHIRANLAVMYHETTYRDAVEKGALAFFGDRYGDSVRVVQVGSEDGLSGSDNVSVEVCGGTHGHYTGDVGLCHIVSEIGIGAGLRRIEAVTGRAAEELMAGNSALLVDIAKRLQVPVDQLGSRLDGLLEQVEDVGRLAAGLERDLVKRQLSEISHLSIGEIMVTHGRLTVTTVDMLREAGDWIKNEIKTGIIILGTVVGDGASMIIMATDDIVRQGFHSGNVVKEAARVMGGGGGGRPELGQAGGRDIQKLENALESAVEQVRKWKEKL